MNVVGFLFSFTKFDFVCLFVLFCLFFFTSNVKMVSFFLFISPCLFQLDFISKYIYMYKYIFYIQTVSNRMILSGLCVVKGKTLKAAGFADITELGFINEKWVEKRNLAAWFSFQLEREKNSIHPELYIQTTVLPDGSRKACVIRPRCFGTSARPH